MVIQCYISQEIIRGVEMCVDYTVLNQSGPKYSYPLPNIDKVIDKLIGFKLLSFMNVHFGYNQIPMFEANGETP